MKIWTLDYGLHFGLNFYLSSEQAIEFVYRIKILKAKVVYITLPNPSPLPPHLPPNFV